MQKKQYTTIFQFFADVGYRHSEVGYRQRRRPLGLPTLPDEQHGLVRQDLDRDNPSVTLAYISFALLVCRHSPP